MTACGRKQTPRMAHHLPGQARHGLARSPSPGITGRARLILGICARSHACTHLRAWCGVPATLRAAVVPTTAGRPGIASARLPAFRPLPPRSAGPATRRPLTPRACGSDGCAGDLPWRGQRFLRCRILSGRQEWEIEARAGHPRGGNGLDDGHQRQRVATPPAPKRPSAEATLGLHSAITQNPHRYDVAAHNSVEPNSTIPTSDDVQPRLESSIQQGIRRSVAIRRGELEAAGARAQHQSQ